MSNVLGVNRTMHRKLFGLCFIIGTAFTGILLSGCHNQAADDAAQKKSIEGGMPTPAQLQRAEQARAADAKRIQQGVAAQATAQHGPPK
jgi:hypothetical protein